MPSKTLVLFAADNDDGRDLEARLRARAAAWDVEVVPLYRATQRDLVRMVMQKQLIVFDATIAEGHNYAAATAQPVALDDVLLVSRTYLPLNFPGLREGGAPPYPDTRTNDQIMAWLDIEIPDAIRRQEERARFGYLGRMRASLRLQQERWNATGAVFISYRGRHYDQVRALAERIRNGFDGEPPRSVRFYPPGQLAFHNEVMAEVWRWSIAASIDRRIAAADELWIYGTDDFLESWWTQAELVTIAYRRGTGVTYPRIRWYDPSTGRADIVDPDALLPRMSRKQVKRMARIYSNSDGATMGPESRVPVRILGALPLIGRIGYFHDHVFSDDFWEYPLVECSGCANGGGELDVEQFLKGHPPGAQRLREGDILEDGNWTCPSCRTPYTITEAERPRFVWFPIRYGRRTGPEGATVAPLPVFRMRQASAAGVHSEA